MVFMMTVTVKLFATLRQQAGWSERVVSLLEKSTLAELLDVLSKNTPDLKLNGRAVYAAVNQNYSKMDRVLQESDVVAIFPPV